MYLIGYDIGSSSVKACIVDAESGKTLSNAFFPKKEAPILSLNAGWAEQDPEAWWGYLKEATAQAMKVALKGRMPCQHAERRPFRHRHQLPDARSGLHRP